MKRILIINGPNLNLLGLREPHIYGTQTLPQIIENVRNAFADIDIEHYQSNSEGPLITRIQQAAYGEAKDRVDGIVINPGGYTHTSVALRDAIAAIDIPAIEVHISNIASREPFRQHSLISDVCAGTISGLGPAVYNLGVQALLLKQ